MWYLKHISAAVYLTLGSMVIIYPSGNSKHLFSILSLSKWLTALSWFSGTTHN